MLLSQIISQLLIAGMVSFFAITGGTSKLKINLSNIENTKGVMRIAVFNTAQAFKDEKASSRYTVSKSKMSGGKLATSISLPDGTYGIAVYDDENNNGIFDKRGKLIPLEGVGLSMYKGAYLRKPDFDEIKFTLKGDKSLSISMKYF